MMTCREFNELLVDYRPGGLPSDDHARFEAHLTQCSPCVVYLRSYEETTRLAKAAFGHPEDAATTDGPHKLGRTIR